MPLLKQQVGSGIPFSTVQMLKENRNKKLFNMELLYKLLMCHREDPHASALFVW